MKELSQKKENPLCLWIPTRSESFLLETAVNNCRAWGDDIKIFILESVRDSIRPEITNRIKPDYHVFSPVEGLTSRKGISSLKGMLSNIRSLCLADKYPGAYVFNNTTIFSNFTGGIENIFESFNKSAGLSGFRNGGVPVVDPSLYWISLECVEDCLKYITNKQISLDKYLTENVTLSLIAYSLGHHVELQEEDYLNVYNELGDTTVKPIMDFRNAYTAYTVKSDREKLILDKALSFR